MLDQVTIAVHLCYVAAVLYEAICKFKNRK
jgi:hypothetical protein